MKKKKKTGVDALAPSAGGKDSTDGFIQMRARKTIQLVFRYADDRMEKSLKDFSLKFSPKCGRTRIEKT